MSVKSCPVHTGFSGSLAFCVFIVLPDLTDSSCLVPPFTSRPSTHINARRQACLPGNTPNTGRVFSLPTHTTVGLLQSYGPFHVIPL